MRKSKSMPKPEKQMSDVAQAFSERLCELVDRERINKHPPITMEKMAERLGISTGSLSQYLDCLREPKITALVSIAKGLNVSPTSLLNVEGFEESDTFLLDINTHTGLSEKAIQVLHQKKGDVFFIDLLNFIIETTPEIPFFDDLIDYSTSDLWDDLAYDDRYNTLPGTADPRSKAGKSTTSQLVRKDKLTQLFDDLQSLKEMFYKKVLCHSRPDTDYFLTEFTQRNLDFDKIEKIAYPFETRIRWSAKQPPLTLEEMKIFEDALWRHMIERNSKYKDYDGILPAIYSHPGSYEESVASPLSKNPTQEELSHHRAQALTFLWVYLSRKKAHNLQPK